MTDARDLEQPPTGYGIGCARDRHVCFLPLVVPLTTQEACLATDAAPVEPVRDACQSLCRRAGSVPTSRHDGDFVVTSKRIQLVW